ncbi:pyridoxine biosynthesis protein [Arthrobotrys conoides]|uniref:Pyridoxine biosynthesis protein n=1 Tax=Arthrobotrys conoides TaxID=74498 RepID=A0AAN8P175_9PEZI
MTSTMSSALRSSQRLLRPAAYSWRAVAAAAARGISSTPHNLKAHNFNMPALSPTMTEGTITSWRINEGDKFAAGDVILEVETDKAQMDVEAQDDGILAKIFVKASKDAVQVGTRIGVLADIEDDISSLEIPPESTPKQPQESSSSSSPPPPPPPKEEPKSSSSSSSSSSTPQDQPQQPSHKPRKNPFIPTPGLIHLLHTNGLQMSDITGTGPQGRVLKGDILAHLGQIDKNKPKSLATDISKLSKLDLSKATPKKQPPPQKKKPEQEIKKKQDPLEEIEVSIPISLSNLNTTTVPVETTIAQAIELANSGLPPSKIPATPAELFDEILGLPSIRREPKYSVKTSEFKSPALETLVVDDLFDQIIGISNPRSVKQDPPSGLKEFKVKVPAIDRDRAEFFLAKVKFSLEQGERGV